MARTILTADWGCPCTEDEFDGYCAFVEERIGTLCAGFDVEVETSRYGVAGSTRYVCDNDREREVLVEAHARLWDEWCGGGWDSFLQQAYSAMEQK